MRTRSQEPPDMPVESMDIARARGRKRRASSPTSPEPVQHDGIVATQVTKKRKKTSVVSHAAPSEALIAHPQLPTINEDVPSQLDEPIQPYTSSQTITKITTTRRATISPSALSRASVSTDASRSRKSLPAGLISPYARKAGLHSLDLIIQERIKRKRDAASSAPGSPAAPIQYDNIMVCADVDGPSQLDGTDDIAVDTAFVPIESSPVSVADSAIGTSKNISRSAFENAIKDMTEQVEQAKSVVKIITVELQAMGFGRPGDAPEDTLAALHNSFDGVRTRLRDIMPLETAEDVLDDMLLAKMADHILHLSQQNDLKATLITDKTQFDQQLLEQINALVERLADGEMARDDLETELNDLLDRTSSDNVYIDQMVARLKLVDAQTAEAAEYMKQLEKDKQDLKDDNTIMDADLERLRKSLVDYRQSEEKLQALITRMEANHNRQVQENAKKHAAEVDTMSHELATEKGERQAAEARAREQFDQYNLLKESLARETAIISDLRPQIERLRTDLVVATDDNAALRDDNRSKAALLEQMSKDLAASEDNIAALTAELEKVNNKFAAERRQREAAETELDETAEKVKGLEDKLHKQGREANELRQKLFEVQQTHAQTVEKLEATHASQQEQYETDLAEGSAREQELEELADNKQNIIEELERQIADIEKQMEKTFKEKEALLQAMEDRAVELETQLDSKDKLLKQRLVEIKQLKKTLDTDVAALRKTIANLEDELVKQSALLKNTQESAANQQEQMTTTLRERDTTIANLTNLNANAAHDIDALSKKNASLERRVTDEAEAMLASQNEAATKIDRLKAALAAKQAELAKSTTDASTARQSYETTITGHETTISSLKAAEAIKVARIDALEKGAARFRDDFAAYVLKTNSVMAGMREELARLQGKLGKESEALEGDADELLAGMDAAATGHEGQDPDGGLVNGDGHHAVDGAAMAKKKVRRVSRKVNGRKARDSGFGGSDGLEEVEA